MQDSTAVIGMQWGDEAKAKIVDFLCSRTHYKYGVRYNGGSNAGHTVLVGNEKRIYHLVPSGGEYRIIANGVVVDPAVLVEEMKGIENNLYVSDRALLMMPQNGALEAALEAERGADKIGTTNRAIGQTYAMHALRTGFRVCDLVDSSGRVDKDKFSAKLDEDPLFKILQNTWSVKLSRDEIKEKYFALAEQFKHCVADTSDIIYEALRHGDNILFEGAQGGMLDTYLGTYPYNTGSCTGVGGIIPGTGVAVYPNRVVGVFKAYTTRVGGGPFPTELTDETGKRLQEVGKEFGATTGRPRRCGWFDLNVARHTIIMNKPTELVITKLDVLDGLDEVKVCTHYQLDGKPVCSFPARLDDLARMKPMYDVLAGWKTTTNAKQPSDLEQNTQDYINYLYEELGVPIKYVTNGAERNQVIEWKTNS